MRLGLRNKEFTYHGLNMSGSLILGVTYIAVWFRFVLFLVLPTPDAGYRLQFIMIQEQ